MHIIKIPKGNGKFRKIHVPNHDEKRASKEMIARLTTIVQALDEHNVHHGFMPGRSPVTNALEHVGFMFTLSFDLKDWFDSIKEEVVIQANIDDLIAEFNLISVRMACFYNGHPVQGLPSSPMIANLAAIPIINDILALQTKGRFKNFVFTMYADDLSFSANSMDVIRMLQKEVPRIVKAHGYRINNEKTHLQCSKAGRRIICGVAVDYKVYPTRRLRRKLRAALHQKENGFRYRGRRKLVGKLMEIQRRGKKSSLNLLQRLQIRGLKEWVELRLPAKFSPSTGTAVPIAATQATATDASTSSGARRFQ